MNIPVTAFRLKTLRNIKGLTPKQLAEKAELNLSDYENMESGKTPIPKDKLKKVCDALDIKMEDWFDIEKSKVFIGGEFSGEFKAEGSSNLNTFNCENCYFGNQNDENIEMLKSLTKMLQVMLEKMDTDALSHKLDQIIKKDKKK